MMLRDDIASPSAAGGLSRRLFLTAGAAVGGGLLLSVSLPGLADQPRGFAPNAFIRIGRDGVVTLIMSQVEMGQGTYTSMPMLIAEELEVPLSAVVLEAAPADDKLYGNPALGFQVTGGSTSVRAFWTPLRQAGAAARMLLIAAAAENWKVDPSSCHADQGVVIHGASGKKLGYGALVDKAATLPMPASASITLKDPRDFKLIGKSVRRLDSPSKVNGTAIFGIDAKLPAMKFASIAICPMIGGTLGRLDDTKAKQVKGVRQIVKLDGAVVVVADHTGAARKGLAALEIEWQPAPGGTASSDTLISELDTASKSAGAIARQTGDAAKAMAGAAHVFDAVYELPFLAHAPMEPKNCTAHVQKDRCDVWVGTQVMTRARAVAAEVTGLPIEKVEVHNHVLGGGFGGRLDTDAIKFAVSVAKQVDGPVKLIWSREEDTQHDFYRPYYYDRLKAGLDASGKPVAWTHRVTGSSILARWAPPAFKNGIDSDAVEGAEGPYAIDNLLIDYVRHEPPAGFGTGWWRGVGMTHNAFMVEGFIDELAHEAKQDPVAYRRALLAKAPRALAVLNLVADKAGWGQKMPAGSGRGVSVLFGFGSYVAQIAEVTVDAHGKVRVTRVVSAIDCGRIVNPDTVKAQVEGGTIFGLTAALYGDITLKNGKIEQANFDTYQMLRIDEAPVIETHLVDSSEEPGGIGEPGTASIAPAVVNAVFAATGKRLRKLPIATATLKTALNPSADHGNPG